MTPFMLPSCDPPAFAMELRAMGLRARAHRLGVVVDARDGSEAAECRSFGGEAVSQDGAPHRYAPSWDSEPPGQQRCFRIGCARSTRADLLYCGPCRKNMATNYRKCSRNGVFLIALPYDSAALTAEIA